METHLYLFKLTTPHHKPIYGLMYRLTMYCTKFYRFKICSNLHIHEEKKLYPPFKRFLFGRKLSHAITPPKWMQIGCNHSKVDHKNAPVS
jgi:hypothetical protein